MNPSSAKSNRKFQARVGVLIATVLGAGYIPLVPGTVGSAVSVAGFIVLRQFGGEPFIAFHAAAVALLTLIGVWACSETEKSLGRRDPRQAIIDEVIGQQVALMGLPYGALPPAVLWASGWKYFLAAFILFRIFDVGKPFPIRRSERLPGGWGVIADDVVAGAFSLLILLIWRMLRA